MVRRDKRTSVFFDLQRAVRLDPTLLDEGPTEVCRVLGLNPERHKGNVHRYLERMRRTLAEDGSHGVGSSEDAPAAVPLASVILPPPVESVPPAEAASVPSPTGMDPIPVDPRPIAAPEVLALTRKVFRELADYNRLRRSHTGDLINLVELLTKLVPMIDKTPVADLARRSGAVLPLNPLRMMLDERRRAASQ